MGYFQVRYGSKVVNFERRGFIRLATGYSYLIRTVSNPKALHNTATKRQKYFRNLARILCINSLPRIVEYLCEAQAGIKSV